MTQAVKSQEPVTRERLGSWKTLLLMLRTAVGTLRRHGMVLVPLVAACQLIIALLALPLIQWIFRGALATAGLTGFELADTTILLANPTSLLLLALVVVVALLVASLQLCLVVSVTYRLQSGLPLRAKAAWGESLTLLRRLARPGSALLLLYLFLILPLANVGFVSVLTQGVAIPNFISGELLKTPSGAALYLGFLLVIGYVNIRLVLTLPVFVASRVGAAQALATSWRLTRWQSVSTVLSALAVLLTAGVVALLLTVVGVAPTILSDLVAPEASPVVAGFSLAVLEIAGFLTAAVVMQLMVSAIVALYRLRAGDLSADPKAFPTVAAAAAPADAPRRRAKGIAVLCVLAVICGLGFVNIPVMTALNEHPDTVVLGHRGFVDGGVENTIPALEAAAAAGADRVEMDVLQTKDLRFVVMHDANLARLSGQDVNVADLTLDQLTAITVRDELGHEATIPSLAAYVGRAHELGMPLLIEFKVHGHESPDVIQLFVNELDSLDAMEANIFHSLDKGRIEELKRLRPDAYAGYILAIAAQGLPPTTADFYVLEEYSYTPGMRDQAWDAGKAMFVWTVNEDESIRERLRDNVDGIITDHPDRALATRADMDDQDGFAETLFDAIMRFVVVV